MAKIDDVTIDVTANLTIPDDTAERCLRILEMWMDDNPGKTLLCDVEEADGRLIHRMRIANGKE